MRTFFAWEKIPHQFLSTFFLQNFFTLSWAPFIWKTISLHKIKMFHPISRKNKTAISLPQSIFFLPKKYILSYSGNIFERKKENLISLYWGSMTLTIFFIENEFGFVTDSYIFLVVRNFISFLLGRHLNKKQFQSIEKIYPEILG